MTAGHRPAYSSGHHGGEPQLRAILDDFGKRFGKYVLNLNGHSHDYERTQAAGARRPRHRRDRRRRARARRDAVPVGRLQAARRSVAFRAIHHGFVKLTVRADGIALEADLRRRRHPTRTSVRCADGEIIDEALIAPGP